jgi:hypothetical protein
VQQCQADGTQTAGLLWALQRYHLRHLRAARCADTLRSQPLQDRASAAIRELNRLLSSAGVARVPESIVPIAVLPAAQATDLVKISPDYQRMQRSITGAASFAATAKSRQNVIGNWRSILSEVGSWEGGQLGADGLFILKSQLLFRLLQTVDDAGSYAEASRLLCGLMEDSVYQRVGHPGKRQAPSAAPLCGAGKEWYMISRTLTLAATVMNVVLAVMLYRAHADQRAGAAITEIRPGAHAPVLAGEDIQGQRRSVDYSGSAPTVLYVFSPDCAWCKRNEHTVDRLVHALADRARFVGLSLDREGLLHWVDTRHPGYEVLTDLSYRTLLAYGFTSTPTTLVISGAGSVERVWHGAYRGETLREIERYFNVSLPAAAID